MRLSQQQIDSFNREGFLVAENALKDSDLNPLIQEYEAYIDRRARELLAAGKISQLYTNQPFEKCLACICRENSEIYGELDIMHFRGRALFDFLRNDHLMDVVESLVGPEITCNPIQHVRAKLPSGLSPTGGDTHVAAWHQDAAVMREEADPHFVLTVWLPLCEATPENGCLQIIPCVNGSGLLHRQAATLTPSEMPEGKVITLPMQKGSVLLMHKETPHRSTPNSTDTIRWSMDLRYQKTGTPTGRSFYPDFVTRSRANPDSVLVDHAEWGRLWMEALEQSKGEKAYRWH